MGVRSAGVQRQYSGTAGRTENCQIGTFLAYASARGHALIDRELYLPESWIDDRDRCRAAGVPDEAEFVTEPRQAMAMLARAFDAGVPFSWITADEAYGQVKYLRVWLETRDAAHVLATRRNDTLITITGGQARADEGACPDPHRLGTRTRTLAARPPLDQRPHPDRLLHLLRPHHRTRVVLVHLAPATPAPSPPQPLQTTRIPTHPSAVAVLTDRNLRMSG